MTRASSQHAPQRWVDFPIPKHVQTKQCHQCANQLTIARVLTFEGETITALDAAIVQEHEDTSGA